MTARSSAPASLRADQAALADVVSRLARLIEAEHPDGVTLVGVLKGSLPLVADLARAIRVPVRLDFVAVTPYDGKAERTKVVKDLDRSVEQEAVVLVCGIIDTGLTADFLRRHLHGSRPRSVQIATLVDRQTRRIVPVQVDYPGIPADDEYLIGYGLDYAGRYRNLPELWSGSAQRLVRDPDCYLAQLYGRGGASGR